MRVTCWFGERPKPFTVVSAGRMLLVEAVDSYARDGHP